MKTTAIRAFCSAVVAVILMLVSMTYCQAHDYSAPFFYLAGVYSHEGKPSYPPASDAEMDWLLKQMQSNDDGTRVIAAGALGQTGDKRAVEPLIKALNDKNKFVQMNAAMGFVHICDPRVIEPLKKTMESPDEGNAAAAAVFALAAQGDAGIEILASIPKQQTEGYHMDEIPDTRDRYVVDALCVVKGDDTFDWAVAKLKARDKKMSSLSLSVLKDLCNFDSQKKRIHAAFSDPEFAQVVLDAVLISTLEDRVLAAEILLSVNNNEILNKFFAAVNDNTRKDHKTLLNVISKLGELGYSVYEEQVVTKLDKKSIANLVKQVNQVKESDEDDLPCDYPPVIAANTLAESSNPEAVSAIVKLLSSKRKCVSELAAYVLRYSGNPVVVKQLLVIAKDKKHPANAIAPRLLMDMRDPSLVPYFVSLLKHKDEKIATSAMFALAKTKNSNALQHLLPLLKEPKYQYSAVNAIARLEDPAAADAIIPLLKFRDKDKHGAVRQVVVGSLVELCNKPDSTVIDKLKPFINDPEPGIRIGVAEVFMKVDDPGVVDVLIPAVADKDADVRRMVAATLAVKDNPKVATALLPLLKESNVGVRRDAAWSIARYPQPEFADALVSLMKDNDKTVRKYAAVALGQLGDNREKDWIVKLILPEQEEEEFGVEQNQEYIDRNYNIRPSAIKAAGKLRDVRAVLPILGTLGEDGSMSIFDGNNVKNQTLSRNAKIEALKSITGQDFGYAYYRWMAYWISQGNVLNLGEGFIGAY